MANEPVKKPGTNNPRAKELYDEGGKLFEENKFEEAIEQYTKAIEKDPDYASAYFNRALSFAILNKYDNATKDAGKVLSLEPDSCDAPYVMGIISEYKHDNEDAVEWYEKSLKANPDYEQARSRLNALKERMGSPGRQRETSAGAKQESKTVVEDGQIKQVKWFKSNLTFKDVAGMKKEKELIYNNIILAITKPDLLRAYGKKLGVGVLFYGPPGCGKCVTGDAKVMLPDGRCSTIEEVVEKREPYVLTLTAKHKLAVRKVSGWWKLDGKPLLAITTKRGRTIKCTPEHPFLVREGWRNASALREGDKIGVPRHIPIFGNNTMRECEIKLLAYFISEGCLTQSSPRFTNSDEEILEDFNSAVRQFDGVLHVNTRVEGNGVLTLQVAGRYLTSKNHKERSSIQKFLDLHDLSYTNSNTKKIPPAVFTLQKRLLSLFLNRLFSGDGWFEDREEEGVRYGTRKHRVIGYSSNSETLIEQVQHLLLRFGILSSKRRKEGGNFELLVWRHRDIDLFIDEIGLFGQKAALLFKMKNSWSKIKKKGGNRVVYEEIKRIENIEAPEHVYDLTVDETHNFVANDFFVHNTYLVRAIAGETKANFIVANINEIVDMYAGNTEKNMHALFEQARHNAPCVVFFDEVDALGTKREGEQQSTMRMAVNQFLLELDGVEKNPEGIFVVTGTNQPWDVDPALKRSGRLGESIYVPQPDYKTRKQAFIYNTSKMPLSGGISFGRLARATMGYSQADVAEICDKSALRVAVEEDKTGVKRKIKLSDFMAIIKKKGTTLDEWYSMVKKDIISKTETQIVEGKKQEIVKEGKLSAEEKARYKDLIKDVKKNSNAFQKGLKKVMRFWAVYIF
jgi:ATP-dependent 26S proteasome regulatory subunit/intein/homing endonuclease